MNQSIPPLQGPGKAQNFPTLTLVMMKAVESVALMPVWKVFYMVKQHLFVMDATVSYTRVYVLTCVYVSAWRAPIA